MTRSRASAKKAGAAFERLIADALAHYVDDGIDRRVKRGVNDRGDIGGVRIRGHRLVIEAKNCARMDLPGWVREAQLEAGNDDALAGVVISKRHGVADPLSQWVHMEVRDLVALINGRRPDEG